jgi:hypothetical protein
MEHTSLEQQIRQRAYEIWHAHGQADGRADEHWLAAEREVLSSLSAHAPAADASATAKTRKRAPRSSRTPASRAAKAGKSKS